MTQVKPKYAKFSTLLKNSEVQADLAATVKGVGKKGAPVVVLTDVILIYAEPSGDAEIYASKMVRAENSSLAKRQKGALLYRAPPDVLMREALEALGFGVEERDADEGTSSGDDS